MQNIWLIGAGKFGRLAAKRLEHKFKILMIDSNEDRLSKKDSLSITYVLQDGIQFLEQNLLPNADVAWIIPCLPVHLAWEWCRRKLGAILIPHALPAELETLLPNPLPGKNTDIYVSHADFLCPDNCNEPDIYCTRTKQPRKQDMHALLESLTFRDYQSLVLKSRQLGPGVGGYSPEDLIDFQNKIKKNQKGDLLISTACRCHGVVTGAKLLPMHKKDNHMVLKHCNTGIISLG
ncbi:MAG: potassium transporter [Desulfobacula sp.]|nr:potassium transporter [Desulfobacula sp.]